MSLVQATHSETGCLLYDLHRDENNASLFVIIERFLSKQDVDVHYASPHFSKHFSVISSLLEKEPDNLFDVGITGARYTHLERGPCPKRYEMLFEFMIREGLLLRTKGHNLAPSMQADLSVFSDSEKEILENIAKLAEKDGGKKLLGLSHKEDAYKNSQSLSLISYEYAKHLKI